MPGGVQLAAEHRGPAHRRAVSDLSRRLLLRVQRAVAGRPYLPRAPAHDVTLTLSWKQVSQAPADCSHTVEGVRQDKTCYCCKQTANLIMIELIVFFFTAHCLNCKSADTFPIFKSTALPLHIKKKDLTAIELTVQVMCRSSPPSRGPELNVNITSGLIARCSSAVPSVSSPLYSYITVLLRSCGSARLTDVIGESLTYIGIPLSQCQREEEGGHRAS